MTFHAEDKFDESRGEFRVRRAAEHGNRIDTGSGATFRQDEAKAALAIGSFKALDKVPGIEVDAHAGGGFAFTNVEGNFGRAIRPIAGIGPDALDDAHALEPTGGVGLFFGRIIGGVPGRVLHGLLQDGFHHFYHGAAFARIGEGDLIFVAWIS